MVRSTAVGSAARNSLRRAAALAATGTLAVLATAGPALADSAAPAPVAGVAAVSGAARDAQPQPQQVAVVLPQTDAPQPTSVQYPPPPCEYHHGLVTSLLDGVGLLLSKLLGVLL